MPKTLYYLLLIYNFVHRFYYLKKIKVECYEGI